MGAHLALRTLAETSPALDAAVLVAPMLGLNSGPLGDTLAAAITRGLCALGLGRVPAWREDAHPIGSPRSKQHILTGSVDRFADAQWWKEVAPELGLGPPTWAWLASAYRSTAALRAPGALEHIVTPILFVAAKADRLVRLADIRAAAARLPRARLHVLPPPAAHEILREVDDIRLAAHACIDAFLDEVAPA